MTRVYDQNPCVTTAMQTAHSIHSRKPSRSIHSRKPSEWLPAITPPRLGVRGRVAAIHSEASWSER
eukprot:6664617-Prymnesium_polylepis.1